MADVSRSEIERLYRAVADREPTLELLQMIYDLFGASHDLRPPLHEMRVARLCGAEVLSHG